MSLKEKVKIWLGQTRANFLILSVVLVMIAGAAALDSKQGDILNFILILIGVILAHISVNLFNEYSDYKTGIDYLTERTPFSGGSGTLQAKLLTPQSVLIAAIGTLIAAFLIGLYLAYVSTWYILGFMFLGGIAIVFYTTHLAKWTLGELFAGLCLGTFVVLGGYVVLTKNLTLPIIIISIPPGILTFLLLLLNEFPDVEADKQGGRNHLVIKYGKQKASLIYTTGLILTYLIIIGAILTKTVPITLGISLLTIPIAFKAASIALKHYDDRAKLIPALGMNVLVVILTDLLLAIGYIL